MTHHTRPTHFFLKLNLVALALLHACVFAPRPRASQTASRNPVLPAPASPELPAPVLPVRTSFGVPYDSNLITKRQLLYALRSREHDEAALVRLVGRRGVQFLLTAGDDAELRADGATDRLLEAVRQNRRRSGGGGMGVGMGVGPGMGMGSGTPSGGGIGSGEGAGIGFGQGRAGVGPGRGPRPGPAGVGSGPNSEPVDYTRPFRQNDVTKKAMITHKPRPGFTEEAQRNGVTGVVRLRAVLNFSGEVTNIYVVKGLPDGLTEKAVAAARRIKFTPAEKDGHKVSQYVVLEYNFSDTPDEQDAVERLFRPAVVEKTFDKSEVDERAIILEKPEAEYTEAARSNNVRGKVVLKVRLTSLGFVVVDSVKAELPHGLTEKAAEAARRIKFEPARRGGLPVSQRATVEYVFAP
jgi:TonB family protein